MIERLYKIYDEAYDYFTKNRRFDSEKAHDFAIACVNTVDNRAESRLTLNADIAKQIRESKVMPVNNNHVKLPTFMPDDEIRRKIEEKINKDIATQAKEWLQSESQKPES